MIVYENELFPRYISKLYSITRLTIHESTLVEQLFTASGRGVLLRYLHTNTLILWNIGTVSIHTYIKHTWQ